MTGADLLARLHARDPRALPRLLTLVENGDPAGIDALRRLAARSGRTHVVGITGPPGSGKSSLVNALVGELRQRGQRVAVVAVDPSSPVTGGAVLGDRIRMSDRHRDADVYFRSMASRGASGGLATATRRVVRLLGAAGFPIVLVETVGTGQDGVDIAGLADTVVVVQVPGLGDGVQAIKAGILEIGDILVVNKGDLPGSADVQRQLRDLGRSHPDDPDAWRRPVMPTIATEGAGIAALADTLDAHRAWLGRHPGNRDRLAAAREIGEASVPVLRHAAESGNGWLSAAFADIDAGLRTPDDVAAELVRRATAQ